MQYRYEVERQNYEDYAAGRVLVNKPGATSFPVRLASEIFQRGMAHLREQGNDGPYTVYDPCCGTGYLLTVLGFLHGMYIDKLIASDFDGEMLEFAERNLALLTPEGMDERVRYLRDMIARYGKVAHADALRSAADLKLYLEDAPEHVCFIADATEDNHLDGQSVDMLIMDVPYGQNAQWYGEHPAPLHGILAAQRPKLKGKSVLIVITDKGQEAAHDAYQRIERFNAGKRRVTIFKLK